MSIQVGLSIIRSYSATVAVRFQIRKAESAQDIARMFAHRSRRPNVHHPAQHHPAQHHPAQHHPAQHHPAQRKGPVVRIPARDRRSARAAATILLCQLLSLFLCMLWASAAVADEATEQAREFFEARIRPVLVERCYECHNSADAAEGGLAVDHRQALLRGGDGGAIVVPGDPKSSRLLPILRHQIDGFEMPQDGPKLDDAIVADFEKWIATGAYDPRDDPPSADEVAAVTSWEATLQRRKQWWSWQPIDKTNPPDADDPAWNQHPVDRFIFSRLRSAGLQPADPADAHTLVRRLYINLIGLPPTREQATRWAARLNNATAHERDSVFGELVDHLLEQPHFGERWARHWMDWIRYAESHGSEGDPKIDQAWVYRDYLIRALNADVPYDQLVLEHIAGDLLQQPRVNEQLGINESAIGPAHWRMVFHGFAPTDALDEKVRFTDDQINAFSKAFLGLTISCARCHDHKFDAISQRDYYALFGILGECRPGRTTIDLPNRLHKNRDALVSLKNQIRSSVANEWLDHWKQFETQLVDDERLWKQANQPGHALHPLYLVSSRVAKGIGFSGAWRELLDSHRQNRRQWQAQRSHDTAAHQWKFNSDDEYAAWFRKGAGLPERPFAAGQFSIQPDGETAIARIFPSGIYSNSLSSKHAARLMSPDFTVDGECNLWLRVIGDSQASVRYVVQHYPRDGTVYPVARLKPTWSWQRFDLSYWKGDVVHVELVTAKDAPLLVKDDERSWFGIREAFVAPHEAPPPVDYIEHFEPVVALTQAVQINSIDDLARAYGLAITEAVTAWKNDTLSDSQALLLDACLRDRLLPNTFESLPEAAPLLDQYRRLEDQIPVPTRVPGLDETVARDQPLFHRGDHRQPRDEVPRRFLEAIDPTPYATEQSGRRELARDLLRPDNPLTRRVIVNRVWHHLFGQGIVGTPDNFGRLGQMPSHPQLLDWLAVRFTEEGWSLKQLIRLIVTSRTWQLSAEPSTRSLEFDPDNRLLSHAHVRRLEAEAIRDSLLAVSGQLDDRLFGAPVNEKAMRRSIYLPVIRNSLHPFLRAFDLPEPFSSVGRRNVTNVPAQSLTMMNDAQVRGRARAWAERMLNESSPMTPDQRIREMFIMAFGRPATQSQVARSSTFIRRTKDDLHRRSERIAQLQIEIDQARDAIERLLQPVRERLLREANVQSNSAAQSLPMPLASWDFEKNGADIAGTLPAQVHGDARFEDGSLVVGGRGYATTPRLQKTIRAKTLAVWVRLEHLNQRGGGAMTIQTPDGKYFDSIVFGEQQPGHWIAGSNYFARTEPFAGPAEAEAAQRPVHIAIAYHDDGQISAYRNGVPYGKSYMSDGPFEFKANQAVVTFGLRHFPPSGNRMLVGHILQARLYDRALSADEIALTSESAINRVPESRVIAALSSDHQVRLTKMRKTIADLEADLQSLGPQPEGSAELIAWTEFATALFTTKEFIYVR